MYGCFELKYLTLLVILIPCSWTQDNIPSFNATCDSTGLHVKIAFSKPFSGIVFAKGYRFDPLCSTTESSALNGFLTLPLSACGTYVQETDYPWITNTIVIQQHPLIRTADDFEKSLICSLPSLEVFRDPPLLLDQIYESYSMPLMDSAQNTEFISGISNEDNATIFDGAKTRLTIFHLLKGTTFNDIGIKSCIAHNEGILDGNASIHQISSPEGCFSANSKESSNLTVIETDKSLIAHLDIDKLGLESSNKLYLTCEIVFCKTKCECSETSLQQAEQPTSVISHKLTKRSIDTSEEFSLNQYDARTRYLKSTVKALMDKIVRQRKQNNESKVRKRLMRSDDSSFLPQTNSVENGTDSIKIFSTEPVLADMERNFTDDVDYDSETDEYPDDYQELTPTTISTAADDLVFVTLPDEFKDNCIKTVSDDIFPEQDSIDVVSPLNETSENAGSVNTSISFSPDDANIHHGSCVPRLRFNIVIIVMGFFMGCLLLTICGMSLYIRKEKKRNRLNDFLLYSIGF